MTKQRVAFNSFDFRIYKREYFSFNLMVVAFDNLFEIVGANCVSERIDFRDGLVGLQCSSKRSSTCFDALASYFKDTLRSACIAFNHLYCEKSEAI